MKFFTLTILAFVLNTQISLPQWVQTGLENSTVHSLCESGNNLFAGTYLNGIFLSSDNGISWTQVNSGLTDFDVFAIINIDQNIFAGTWGGGVFLSTNNGSSWTAVNTGLNLYVNSLALSGSNLFAGTSGGVFLSTDYGTSWTRAWGTAMPTDDVFELAVSGSNLFASTEGSGIFLSTDNGTNWQAVNNGLTNTKVRSFYVSGTNILAGTSGGGIFLSTDNGTIWIPVNNGLSNEYVYSFAAMGTNIFAGTWGGVFLSTNNGTNWISVNTGTMSSYNINSLMVSDTNLFAGTIEYGAWRRTLSNMITSVDQQLNNQPLSYKLEQNYPNPFNPVTTISWQSPRAYHHSLKIFDVMGSELAVLVDEYKPAGNYTMEFDASVLPSGVYFYTLNAGEYVETKKMVLLR